MSEMSDDYDFQLHQVMRKSPIGMAIIDFHGRFEVVNPSYGAIYGYAEAELTGNSFTLVFPHDQQRRVLSLHQRFLTEDGELGGEWEVVRKDGARRQVLTNSICLIATDGRKSRLVYVTDITDRKLSEEKMRMSESRLAAMLRGANDGYWDWTLKTDQLYYSPQWWSMLGYADGELVATSDLWRTLMHPGDAARINHSFGASLVNGTGAYVETFRLLHKDGHYVPVESHGYIERDQSGTAIRVSGANVDLSERSATEAELLSAKAQAELANNAKSRFLAAVSHDLRQPLAALTLYVDLIDPNAPEKLAQLLPRIKNCSSNLGSLLGNLLDLSKLQAGAIVPTLTSIPVSDVLAALQSVHAAQAAQKGLQLRVRPCALTIRTDHTLMLRLLGNLVANAVQHTSRGGVLIAFRRHAQSQWFTVYDTGIGIAGDKIESIFDEFSQVTRNSGSGLGLYIVAKTAELLGLQVRVRSVVGRGSMFAVELPVADPTADLILSTRQSSTAPGHARLRVALVDDNTEVLQALTLALEQMGHDVVWATTGMDVIARLDGHAPDLIVTDYHLADGETGADVIEDARAIFGEDLPAVIITADTNKYQLNRLTLDHMIVMYKPIQMDALRAAIAEVTG